MNSWKPFDGIDEAEERNDRQVGRETERRARRSTVAGAEAL